jgi:hypothetical protein
MNLLSAKVMQWCEILLLLGLEMLLGSVFIEDMVGSALPITAPRSHDLLVSWLHDPFRAKFLKSWEGGIYHVPFSRSWGLNVGPDHRLVFGDPWNMVMGQGVLGFQNIARYTAPQAQGSMGGVVLMRMPCVLLEI